jgi:hypothetical protein
MNVWLTAFGLACIMLAISSLSPQAQAAPPALPPRPTPAPTLSPRQDQVLLYDSHIQLIVSPARARLWTVVQWQDAFGNWHDVEGWRGTLDDFVGSRGEQVWWVAQADRGTGPFRWLVYDRPNGNLLARSELFNLPTASGQTVSVQVSLAP